jgi:single-stranded DNA-binding protein
MNPVALVGNITDDPELRYTQRARPSQASPSP